MKKYIILVALLSIITTLNSYIIESNTLDIILEHITSQNTLVVLDIDNTVLHPCEEVASDEWCSYLAAEKVKEGFSPQNASTATLPYSFYAHHYIKVELTEPTIPALIKSLLDRDISVIALTARNSYLSEITYHQLKSIGVEFLFHHAPVKELVFTLMCHPSLYRYNMLFVGNNDKGQALKQLLAILDYHPDTIIFADDKLKYLISLEEAFKDTSTTICGIRYSGCDERVKNFSPEKAQEQFLALKRANGHI